MSKALVIVESSAKVKIISKYLGKDYIVKSSIGHIRDLPTGRSTIKKNINTKPVKKNKKDTKKLLIDRMGINPWHNWKADYQILPEKEKIVYELKRLAKKTDHIYLATDLDREGEAIAWHLREVIGGEDKRYSRVVFNEITKNAIRQAFAKPRKLNINRVNAQQARRFMDRVVGYMISPLLWRKIARGLSAGRVQSVAVRLIVEREQEIKAFFPEEYWELNANLNTPKNGILPMQVTYYKDKPFRPVSKEKVNIAVSLLEKARFQVMDRKDKLTVSEPGAPFITSTLQQSANTYLGFSVKRTMTIAQKLYESGYITYVRTDSTNLSQDAVILVRRYINNHFGKKYLPKNANTFFNKKTSQDAHEAIRPTDVTIQTEQLKNISMDAQKLYQLIWRQFVACQMVQAQYYSTTLIVSADDFLLKVKEHIQKFDGWTKVMPALRKHDEYYFLSEIEIGDELNLYQLNPKQHFTKPPARFSEASLVRELEKRSIGRPSTYAVIISTIQDRGYVRIDSHRFYAEKIGEIVINRLKENFCELMNYDFTARMEDCLDQVANKQIDWKTVLDKFFVNFSKQLKQAEKDPEQGGMQLNQMVLISINCSVCSRQMGIRTASTGVFLSCSGYILSSKERCKKIIHLIPKNETKNLLEKNNMETNVPFFIHRRCQKCSMSMDSYLINNQSQLHVCGNNPSCDGYEIEHGEFHIKDYNSPITECEKCGFEMYLKTGRFGRYMACTNEECKNKRKVTSND